MKTTPSRARRNLFSHTPSTRANMPWRLLGCRPFELWPQRHHIAKIAYQMVLNSVSREFTTRSRVCGERNTEAQEQRCVRIKVGGCLRCEKDAGRRSLRR